MNHTLSHALSHTRLHTRFHTTSQSVAHLWRVGSADIYESGTRHMKHMTLFGNDEVTKHDIHRQQALKHIMRFLGGSSRPAEALNADAGNAPNADSSEVGGDDGLGSLPRA